MGPMILRREVLPPRQTPREAPRETGDFTVEAQTASLTRAIWLILTLLGLSHVILTVLGMYL